MSIVDFSGVAWRKSSRSGNASNDACVEIAFAASAVGVRDSKHRGAALAFGRDAWKIFIREAR